MKFRVVVCVTGARGSIYGFRPLEKLRERAGFETHPILSRAGEKKRSLAPDNLAAPWKTLAHDHYPIEDLGVD